jgi:hypothetical protein
MIVAVSWLVVDGLVVADTEDGDDGDEDRDDEDEASEILVQLGRYVFIEERGVEVEVGCCLECNYSPHKGHDKFCF